MRAAGCGVCPTLSGMGASAWLVVLWAAALAETDRRCGRLPNVLVLPGCGAVVASAVGHPGVLVAALAASVPYVLGFGLRVCGGGDAKFAFGLGGLLADPLAALVMVVLAQVPVLILRRPGPRPHGPAMAVAALLVVAASSLPAAGAPSPVPTG